MGKVITFYSYKGGVGRSMALANIGVLLSKWGKKVLLVDFDLEAPGLENYFETFDLKQNNSKPYGVIDLICKSGSPDRFKWEDTILKYSYSKENLSIDVLPSGRETIDYTEKVQNLDWENLFSEFNLGLYLESLRNEWKENYDFILIDSRTGLSDMGGICTIYLPDILVFLFTTNDVSLSGCIDVVERVKKARDLLPFDRDLLITLPLPSRDESRTENKLAQEWHKKFSYKLDTYYKDWLPQEVNSSDVIDLLRIPYIPIWSFGDKLPVIEDGTTKIDSIGFIYELAAKLILNEFEWYKIHETVQSEERIKNPKLEKIKIEKIMEPDKYLTERVDKQIQWYSLKSQRYKTIFYGLIIIQLFTASLLPIIPSFLDFYDSNNSLLNNMKLFLSLSGAVIFIVSGLLNFGRFRENWLKYRKTAEILKQEKYTFLTNSYPYENSDNFKKFVKTIEEIVSKENLEWENTYKNMNLEKINT